MSPKHSKYCILTLSFCLAVSLGGNIYSLMYPLIKSRAEKETIGWIPTEYTKNIEVLYPEVIPVKPDTETEEAVVEPSVSQEGESTEAVITEENIPTSEATEKTEEIPEPIAIPTTTPKPTEKPVAIQQPSIRYNGATVYVTKSGTKFHRETCSSLSKSKIAISFEEACAKMYEPCGKCKP